MILVLDNYDSFVYNLARYICVMGFETIIYRSDALSVNDIKRLSPEAIIISPGPCTPDEAGISLEVITKLGPYIPILGICLGHQAIGQAFGGTIKKARYPVHGKVRPIHHSGEGIYQGMENPMYVGRYHSLIVDETHIPDILKVTSYSDEGEIMSLEHRHYPIYGMQFHPESLLTKKGYDLLKNFFQLTLGDFLPIATSCEINLIGSFKTS